VLLVWIKAGDNADLAVSEQPKALFSAFDFVPFFFSCGVTARI